MGNCQAAEAATVVILHPGGNKVERIYSSVSANEVMNSHPGHYVAMLVVAAPAAKTENESPTRRLKLLRPDDTLLVGEVYRLVNFEDLLKRFAAKKCVKLGKLLKERGALKDMEQLMKVQSASNLQFNSKSGIDDSTKTEQHDRHLGKSGWNSRGARRRNAGGGQWKPALHSIAEQQLEN